jgi:hypothetical protein
VWRAVLVTLAVLLGLFGASNWPTGAAGYSDRLVKAADGTLSAVRTMDTAAGADTLAPYRWVLVDGARTDVATSLNDVARDEAPDAASAGARDELLTLLTEAARLLTDPDPVAAHRDRWRDLGDRLAAFVAAHR